ncbi:MAG: hypothetical protein K0Q87_1880 [Neobacillus sp.]|jgi:hypothetical protein|nr:hypothetical protein [Neobacillus sp.]
MYPVRLQIAKNFEESRSLEAIKSLKLQLDQGEDSSYFHLIQ